MQRITLKQKAPKSTMALREMFFDICGRSNGVVAGFNPVKEYGGLSLKKESSNSNVLYIKGNRIEETVDLINVVDLQDLPSGKSYLYAKYREDEGVCEYIVSDDDGKDFGETYYCKLCSIEESGEEYDIIKPDRLSISPSYLDFDFDTEELEARITANESAISQNSDQISMRVTEEEFLNEIYEEKKSQEKEKKERAFVVGDDSSGGFLSLSVKGATLFNILENGDFSKGVRNWVVDNGEINIDGDVSTVTGDGSRSSVHLRNTGIPVSSGDEIFIYFKTNMNSSVIGHTIQLVYSEGSPDRFSAPMSSSSSKCWDVVCKKFKVPKGKYGEMRLSSSIEYQFASLAEGKSVKYRDFIVVNMSALGMSEKNSEYVERLISKSFEKDSSTTIRNIKRFSKNMFTGDILSDTYISSDGSLSENKGSATTKPIPVYSGQEITIGRGQASNIRVDDEYGNLIHFDLDTSDQRTITIPTGGRNLYVNFVSDGDAEDYPQFTVESGNSLTSYKKGTLNIYGADEHQAMGLNGVFDDIDSDGRLVSKIEKTTLGNLSGSLNISSEEETYDILELSNLSIDVDSVLYVEGFTESDSELSGAKDINKMYKKTDSIIFYTEKNAGYNESSAVMFKRPNPEVKSSVVDMSIMAEPLDIIVFNSSKGFILPESSTHYYPINFRSDVKSGMEAINKLLTRVSSRIDMQSDMIAQSVSREEFNASTEELEDMVLKNESEILQQSNEISLRVTREEVSNEIKNTELGSNTLYEPTILYRWEDIEGKTWMEVINDEA